MTSTSSSSEEFEYGSEERSETVAVTEHPNSQEGGQVKSVSVQELGRKMMEKLVKEDDSEGARLIYARLKELKTVSDAEVERQHAKIIEIAIELFSDNVNIAEEESSQEAAAAAGAVPLAVVVKAADSLPYYARMSAVRVRRRTDQVESDKSLALLTPSHLALAAGPNRETLLHVLALQGNTTALQKILSAFFTSPPANLSLDLPNGEGRTPLHYASGKGNVEVAQLLLHHSASKLVQDAYGALPFHFAARCGNTTLLEMLQVEDVVDSASSTSGMTALHYAAWNGHSQAVQWLLSHNASVDVTDKLEGNTPLHLAAMSSEGHEDAVEIVTSLIIQGGANVLKDNKKGDWAIGLADKSGNLFLAKAILKAIKKSVIIRTVDDDNSIDTACLTMQQQSTNGATLFHYFAAYGDQEDLDWIVALVINESALQVTPSSKSEEMLNPKDKYGRTVVHWAARKGNVAALQVLAKNKVDLHSGVAPSQPHKTPLCLAVLKGHMGFANEILKWKPLTEINWLSDVGRWMEDYYTRERRLNNEFDEKFKTLQTGFQQTYARQMKVPSADVKKNLFLEIPPIYLAWHAGRMDVANFLQQHSTGVNDAVNFRGGSMGWTALHWAILLEQTGIVFYICLHEEVAPFLKPVVEDALGRTALHFAREMELGAIENALMQRPDVQVYVESMYKDRQVYVDATNAILVGAALIASVTFAGWLQPPLSYTSYYNLPQLPPPSPPDVFQSYAAIQQHVGVRIFWIFNSLSFTMAIATMLAGLVGVAPIPGIFVATSLKHLRRCLVIASAFLGISIMFVLAAFAAAGFAVLPPIFEYQANMMATMVVGGVPCLALLVWFACRLWSYRSGWLKAMEVKVKHRLCPPRRAAGVPVPDQGLQWPREDAPGADEDVEQLQFKKPYTFGPRYHAGRSWEDGLDVALP